jgi:3-mercaptopyruvate sulfurtransferase SseA
VIYCSGDECGSSEDLAYELQGEGFSNLLVFKGGWTAWNSSGHPIEP